MKRFIPALLLCSLAAADAAVSLRFSNINDSLDSLSTSSTTGGVDGLAWGIVVDTAGDGIGGDGIGNPFDKVGVPLADLSFFSDDDLFFYGGTTTTWIGFEAGAGAVTVVNNVDLYGTNAGASPTGVSLNDPFAVVWFESASQNDTITVGTRYGLVEDSSLLIPSDTASEVDFSAAFDGDVVERNPTLSFIPEPSTALLSCLGLGLLFRRRR